MRLPFEEQAAKELEEVALFYERERAGYGTLFMAEVSKKVARAADFPQSGALIQVASPEADIRAFVLRCFPYIVVTAIITERRAVIAIAHQRRGPGYWKARLSSSR